MKAWFLNIIGKLIPPDYSWSVAIKKVAYMAAKILVSLLLASSAGPFISGHSTPGEVQAVQIGITAAIGAVLETVHDWLKVKFPTATWL